MIALIIFFLSIFLMVLSIVLKLAGKLRITLPVLCILLYMTVLNPWVKSHPLVAYGILFTLIGFSFISWLLSLKHFIDERRHFRAMAEDIAWQSRRAREMGVDTLNTCYIDLKDGTLRYDGNDEPVI